MKLTPPTQNVFYLSLLIAAAGVLGALVSIPFLSGNSFWLVLLAYVVLALSNLLKGL